MAKDTKNEKSSPDSEEAVDLNARREIPEAAKTKARKWFERAQELVNGRNYDYAIKCYIDGLQLWPEAVEEAHQPLRGCAAARQHTGGKKPGFGDTMKHSMTHKDPLTAMLNAEWLLAHDPMNVGYMEGLFKNANRARCDDTAMWAGEILRNAAQQEKKPSAKRFALMKEVYEEVGDRAQARGELELAEQAYSHGIEALNLQEQIDSRDETIRNVRRDLSTKLTILKGQYQTAESFTESVRDAGAQAEIHDRERMVQSSDRLAELIAGAEREMRANPGVPGKVMTLVDLLTREDNEEHEKRAIGILVDQFKQHKEYRYKARADDIYMRQLGRQFRRLRESGDQEAAKVIRTKQLRFELNVFAERVKQYPTDMRHRFEFGVRLFQARRFDDAIPAFQAARQDSKNRGRSDLYLGRCFYEKGYHTQAMATLTRALESHEVSDDERAKEIRYWLARAQEDSGDVKSALETYGHLIEMDYNYRDVRSRMDGLSQGSE